MEQTPTTPSNQTPSVRQPMESDVLYKAFHGIRIFVTVFTRAHRELRDSIVHRQGINRCDCSSNVSYCEGVEILHSEIKLRHQRCG